MFQPVQAILWDQYIISVRQPLWPFFWGFFGFCGAIFKEGLRQVITYNPKRPVTFLNELAGRFFFYCYSTFFISRTLNVPSLQFLFKQMISSVQICGEQELKWTKRHHHSIDKEYCDGFSVSLDLYGLFNPGRTNREIYSDFTKNDLRHQVPGYQSTCNKVPGSECADSFHTG